ncbi:MAG: GerAB/ArcD/ProY family transporter [Thermaerobacter sp.]|nr:GerAB/ArcD/ProY family transporter [Thermaerobacter sp.]
MSSRVYRVSSRQLWLLATLLSVCVTPLVLPGLVIPLLGHDAWATGVVSLLGGLLGMGFAAAVVRQFPDRPLGEVVATAFGPVLSRVYLALLALLFTVGAGVNLHGFVAVVAGHDLPLLPTMYPALLIAAVGTFAAYFGPEVIARSAEVLAPLIILGLVIINILAFSNAGFGRLLPLGIPWNAMGSAPVLAALGTARGFLLVLLLGAFAHALPSSASLHAGTLIAAVVITLSCALPVAVFGATFAGMDRFPFVSAVGTTGWQWIPTHGTVLLLIFWHAIVFVVFATYTWLAAWLWKGLLARLPWMSLVVGTGLCGALVASATLSSEAVSLLFSLWNDAVVVLGIAVPALLWMRLRRRSRYPGRRGVEER